MVTKSPTTSLLNKFTDLFRKPDSDEADSENSMRSDVPANSEESIRLLLKSKRRNDAMRVYELNQLRTIIRSGLGYKPPRELEITLAPASQARSSGMGSLERTSILSKIDGAEAHLEQWWGSGSSHAPLTGQTQATDSAAVPLDASDDDLDLDFTGMQAISEDDEQTPYPASGPAPFADDGIALTPIQVGLRDAALLYAEGEFSAAVTTLSGLLATTEIDDSDTELLTFSLLDVYRCSGKQDRFDALALDYASRFGRSPAEWFSLSEEGAPGATEEQPIQAFWKCPAILDTWALADCIAHHPAASQVCSINWLPLQHIDAATATALAKLIQTWCQNPIELHWLGIDSLMAALKMCRSGGDAASNEAWWLIQLDMLCILQQPQVFEELALEYCVAYEVSPPSWKTVACKLVYADDVPQAPEFVSTMPSGTYDSGPQSVPAYALYELKGNVTGENPKPLRELRAVSRSTGHITVSCSRLGRIDISAAGSLYSWAQECQARSCAVSFIYLPRLVQVYFHMLGMDQLASLSAGSH
ncbi:hypothetical protein DIC66_02640 [Rhodoferax lacus]|uniref:MlaB-like STAS domain-containing protein n=1 Tax=Rhodoferax lacus TaxID=2184758 RepID=A0A3E1RIH3_9BURK|nr:STAS domain-containing protein [Rhodoferax lacus]RFO98792.1 hypothetical protein DIC66_02640 [Rhodoferax lacus]